MNIIELDKLIDAHLWDLSHGKTSDQWQPAKARLVQPGGVREGKETSPPPKQHIMDVVLKAPEWSEANHNRFCMMLVTRWDRPNGRGKIEIIPTQEHMKEMIQGWIRAERMSWLKDVRPMIKAWVDEVE